MCTLREAIIFVAGAEFFHTLSHVFINFYVTLPIMTKFFELTTSMNHMAILVNGVITVLLIIWAMKLPKKMG
jgi:hypothetical protein